MRKNVPISQEEGSDLGDKYSWPYSFRWKARLKNTIGWFVVREKHCTMTDKFKLKVAGVNLQLSRWSVRCSSCTQNQMEHLIQNCFLKLVTPLKNLSRLFLSSTMTIHILEVLPLAKHQLIFWLWEMKYTKWLTVAVREKCSGQRYIAHLMIFGSLKEMRHSWKFG